MKSDRDEILSMEYASCSLVLEMDVTWRCADGTTRTERNTALGYLTDEENIAANYEGSDAQREILAFTEAVKAKDPRALAEVKRVLYATRRASELTAREHYYDRREHGHVAAS